MRDERHTESISLFYAPQMYCHRTNGQGTTEGQWVTKTLSEAIKNLGGRIISTSEEMGTTGTLN